MPKNILIANAINVRAINNSLVRVKYLTNKKWYFSYISHRSQFDVRAHMYIGVVISVYDRIIADGKYLFNFHIPTARGSSMICSYYDLDQICSV
jgi:hypothetical protein